MLWRKFNQLTRSNNITDGKVEVMSHEPQDGEHHKPNKDAGGAVQTTQHQAIPAVGREVKPVPTKSMHTRENADVLLWGRRPVAVVVVFVVAAQSC